MFNKIYLGQIGNYLSIFRESHWKNPSNSKFGSESPRAKLCKRVGNSFLKIDKLSPDKFRYVTYILFLINGEGTFRDTIEIRRKWVFAYNLLFDISFQFPVDF